MRMRKKKNGEARLEACSDFITSTPVSPYSDPATAFGKPGAPVFLEIGAGKGGFACEMAKRNPGACYFAMERVSDCVVLAAEKAKATAEERGDNLRFIVDTADNLAYIFECGTVDRIFLNFSDPWKKSKQAKRRLTYRTFLAIYNKILKPEGYVEFKTDNRPLFDFSLEEFEFYGAKIDQLTFDLHNSEYNEGNIQTEYERNFSAKGFTINRCRIKFSDC